MIPLHRPYIAPETYEAMRELLRGGKFSSQGFYSQSASKKLSAQLQEHEVLLTHSCTHALEMSSLILDLKPGDEVIVPSYGFSSTANAFLLRGASIRFADSTENHPNVSIDTILPLINQKTKAIVVIHYAGYPVDMNPILSIAREKHIVVIEDAAQALGAKYYDKPCGCIGDFTAFSFHDTKWIQCGEGGAFVAKNKNFTETAKLILEKGTNRIAFLNNEISKYEWHARGSSYGMSELQAVVLYYQLQHFEELLTQRIKLFHQYNSLLEYLHQENKIKIFVPAFWQYVNGSHYFICVENESVRTRLQQHLAKFNIQSSFHFLALHTSPFGQKLYVEKEALKFASYYESCLLRLPMFHDLALEQQEYISEKIALFFKQ